MRSREVLPLLIAATASTSSCSLMPGHGGAAPPPGFAPCAIPGAEDPVCGTVVVFENRSQRTGRTIALRVVLLPARTRHPAPDPLFIIASGPGQAASSLADFASETFAGIRRQRDIVLVDARGTGGSNPLNCTLYPDLRSYFGDLFPVDAVRACRAKLAAVTDLRQYTTRNLADDLDDVRAALGYHRVNIYGTSYGTAAARVYLARHPAHVRAIVLKAIAPMTPMPVLSFARDAQHAIDRLIYDCTADSACHRAFPNLPAEADSVFERLNRRDQPSEARDPDTGRSQRVMVSRGAFAAALLSALQGPSTASSVPALLHQVYAGDYRPAARLMVALRHFANTELSWGMHFSVICTEANPPVDSAVIARESAGTFLGDYRVQQQIQACREWPRGDSTGFGVIPSSSVPALLSSGELDPNTPPRWGVEAARTLSAARHLVIRYGTHNFGNLHGCLDVLIDRFIDAGSAAALDTSCVSSIQMTPFVTKPEPPEVTLSPELLAGFAGSYHKRIPPITVTIEPLGEILRATLGSRRQYTLVPIGNDRFRVDEAPDNVVQFVVESGRATRMLFELRGRRVSLTRRKD